MTFDQVNWKQTGEYEIYTSNSQRGKRVALKLAFVRVPCGHFVPLEEESQ